MNRRVISFSRWTQYVKLEFPGVRLTRTSEDACDVCIRLDIQLSRDDFTNEESDHYNLEKTMHLSSAIDQLRAMSTFVKQYAAAHAPKQVIPNMIICNTCDEPPVVENLNEHDDAPVIQIQIEVFGGSVALPHYGHSRTSADYSNSSLMLQNFVIADITRNVNHVFFYDECGQGKGADALCSLRLLHHL